MMKGRKINAVLTYDGICSFVVFYAKIISVGVFTFWLNVFLNAINNRALLHYKCFNSLKTTVDYLYQKFLKYNYIHEKGLSITKILVKMF